MSLTPINGHLIIQPVVHEEFIASTNGTYEEIGIVLQKPNGSSYSEIPVGAHVYFDSWLASKYPDGKGGFHWLVKYEDIRAYETISEQ